ncbi:hypothetical protein Ciccas_008378 [Cichlidogyrus casuarinus]|uniref:Uncharacterized protein n=1 Tax=Cichlidogyrus casuarinus TaxID=1844966 RepID=A0ABD2Q0Y2_9PLAT
MSEIIVISGQRYQTERASLDYTASGISSFTGQDTLNQVSSCNSAEFLPAFTSYEAKRLSPQGTEQSHISKDRLSWDYAADLALKQKETSKTQPNLSILGLQKPNFQSQRNLVIRKELREKIDGANSLPSSEEDEQNQSLFTAARTASTIELLTLPNRILNPKTFVCSPDLIPPSVTNQFQNDTTFHRQYEDLPTDPSVSPRPPISSSSSLSITDTSRFHIDNNISILKSSTLTKTKVQQDATEVSEVSTMICSISRPPISQAKMAALEDEEGMHSCSVCRRMSRDSHNAKCTESDSEALSAAEETWTDGEITTQRQTEEDASLKLVASLLRAALMECEFLIKSDQRSCVSTIPPRQIPVKQIMPGVRSVTCQTIAPHPKVYLPYCESLQTAFKDKMHDFLQRSQSRVNSVKNGTYQDMYGPLKSKPKQKPRRDHWPVFCSKESDINRQVLQMRRDRMKAYGNVSFLLVTMYSLLCRK